MNKKGTWWNPLSWGKKETVEGEALNLEAQLSQKLVNLTLGLEMYYNKKDESKSIKNTRDKMIHFVKGERKEVDNDLIKSFKLVCDKPILHLVKFINLKFELKSVAGRMSFFNIKIIPIDDGGKEKWATLYRYNGKTRLYEHFWPQIDGAGIVVAVREIVENYS
jgi:hypothetical protein